MLKTALVLYSQRLDFDKKEWQKNGCAIASLLMLMEFFKKPNKKLPDLNKLYQVGINRRAYIKGVGWRHLGLVGLAKIYGFKSSCAFDLAKEDGDEAWANLVKELKTGPVLASVYYKYEVGNGGHIVVLLGITKDKAMVLDPDSPTRAGVYQTLPLKKFKLGWKKRLIVVRK